MHTQDDVFALCFTTLRCHCCSPPLNAPSPVLRRIAASFINNVATDREWVSESVSTMQMCRSMRMRQRKPWNNTTGACWPAIYSWRAFVRRPPTLRFPRCQTCHNRIVGFTAARREWLITACMFESGVKFYGNAWERRSRALPTVKVIKNPEMHENHYKILRMQSQKFSRGDTPGPPASAPDAWTRTSISAWLAIVYLCSCFAKRPLVRMACCDAHFANALQTFLQTLAIIIIVLRKEERPMHEVTASSLCHVGGKLRRITCTFISPAQSFSLPLVCEFTVRGLLVTAPYHHLQSEVWTTARGSSTDMSQW